MVPEFAARRKKQRSCVNVPDKPVSGAWARRNSMLSGSISGSPDLCRSKSPDLNLVPLPTPKFRQIVLNGISERNQAPLDQKHQRARCHRFRYRSQQKHGIGLYDLGIRGRGGRPNPQCSTMCQWRATSIATAPSLPASTSDWISRDVRSSCPCDTPAWAGESGVNCAASDPANIMPRTLISPRAIYLGLDLINRRSGCNI